MAPTAHRHSSRLQLMLPGRREVPQIVALVPIAMRPGPVGASIPPRARASPRFAASRAAVAVAASFPPAIATLLPRPREMPAAAAPKNEQNPVSLRPQNFPQPPEVRGFVKCEMAGDPLLRLLFHAIATMRAGPPQPYLATLPRPGFARHLRRPAHAIRPLAPRRADTIARTNRCDCALAAPLPVSPPAATNNAYR